MIKLSAKPDFSPLMCARNYIKGALYKNSQEFVISKTSSVGLTGMSHVCVHSICNNVPVSYRPDRDCLHSSVIHAVETTFNKNLNSFTKDST